MLWPRSRAQNESNADLHPREANLVVDIEQIENGFDISPIGGNLVPAHSQSFPRRAVAP